jgi:hypothetical protein
MRLATPQAYHGVAQAASASETPEVAHQNASKTSGVWAKPLGSLFPFCDFPHIRFLTALLYCKQSRQIAAQGFRLGGVLRR